MLSEQRFHDDGSHLRLTRKRSASVDRNPANAARSAGLPDQVSNCLRSYPARNKTVLQKNESIRKSLSEKRLRPCNYRDDRPLCQRNQRILHQISKLTLPDRNAIIARNFTPSTHCR